MGSHSTMVKHIRGLLLIAVLFPSCTFAASLVNVTLGSGVVVKGVINSYGLATYNRIPYAAPPVGNFRFQPPSPYVSTSSVIDGTQTYPLLLCPQTGASVPSFLVQTEDCLVLSVIAPALTTTSNQTFPVMVFIHGGGFRTGSGLFYDGSSIVAENDVVYVSLNYRLGFLGFAALPTLRDEQSDGTVGNYGFLDQQLALKWVKQNIAAFGGNPNKITIFGESAGGVSICFHLANPRSAGLFSAAIVESGPCQTIRTLSTAFSQSLDQANHIPSCSGMSATLQLQCLRAQNFSVIVQSTDNVGGYAGTIDGVSSTDTYTNMIASSKTSLIPILSFANKDEITYFVCPIYAGQMSELVLANVWSNVIGNSNAAANIISFYKQNQADFNQLGNVYNGFVQSQSDAFFKCQSRSVLDAAASSAFKAGLSVSSLPLYFVSLEYVPGFSGNCYQTSHTMELAFLFPTIAAGLVAGLPSGYSFSPTELQLGVAFRRMWANFAKTANPSFVLASTNMTVNISTYCATAADSMSCSNSGGRYLKIGMGAATFTNEVGYVAKQCAFWEANNASLINNLNLNALAQVVNGSSTQPVSAASHFASATSLPLLLLAVLLLLVTA